jgi:hypothetical protein
MYVETDAPPREPVCVNTSKTRAGQGLNRHLSGPPNLGNA